MAQNCVQNQVFYQFFRFSSLIFLEIGQDDSLEHCLDKTLDKNFGSPRLGLKLSQRFCHFLKILSLVFPNIVQDCSLRECLTASRVETSKKKILAKIVVKIIFSVLMLSSVHSNLLVFLTYRENNFCQLSLMLLNVRLTRAMKYQLFITKTRKGRFPAGKAKLV